jgi:hypothetical protein
MLATLEVPFVGREKISYYHRITNLRALRNRKELVMLEAPLSWVE